MELWIIANVSKMVIESGSPSQVTYQMMPSLYYASMCLITHGDNDSSVESFSWHDMHGKVEFFKVCFPF